MPPVVHSYDPPERFVAGTVGEPGERTFFLQARQGQRITSVALEKQQVEILGERMDELLDELLESGIQLRLSSLGSHDNAPLEQPIVEEFRAGTITLSWDQMAQRIVVEVFPVGMVEGPESAEESSGRVVDEDSLADLPIAEPEPSEVLVVRLFPQMARNFAQRAAAVVDAGRDTCPFCANPMDPAGHLCPRANGFRRSSL